MPLPLPDSFAEQQDEPLLAAFRSGPVGLVVTRLRDHVIVDVNATFAQLVGFTREQVVGKTTAEIGILDARTFEDLLNRLLEQGRLEQTDVTIRTREGHPRHFLIGTEIVELGGEAHAITTFIDITPRKIAEAALHERTAQLRAALDMAQMGVWHWNLRTGTHSTVQGSGPVSGLPPELYPRTEEQFFALVHPDDREHVRERLAAGMRTGEYEAEFRIVLPNREIRWVAARGKWVRDAEGVPVSITGLDRDVTARKQTAERIEHLNRVHTMLSSINQTIVRERDAARMLQAACRIAVENGRLCLAWIGLRSADPGRVMDIAAHAGADEETLACIESFLRAEAPCQITMHALRTGQHGICNDIAGDPRTQTWREPALARGYRSMASLPLAAGNDIIGTFNLYAGEPDFFSPNEMVLLDELALDISFALEFGAREAERRQVEAALRESEERFRELAENIREVFWLIDANSSELLYVSPNYERVWGRTRASLYADPQSFWESVHPEDRARVEHAALTRQARGDYDETYRIVRPDGTVRWIHDRAFPVRNAAGEPVRIVGTADDITERRQLEEQVRQAQRMEAVGRLAGGIAHDFNNILTVIQGYCSLLTLGDQAPAQKDAVQEIMQAAERAANLTRQLLAFSRRQVIQRRLVDLNSVVAGIAKMLQRIVGEDIRMRLNLHPGPLLLRADSGMLDQVLMNLVINARDAMPGGGELLIETDEVVVGDAQAASAVNATPGRRVCLRVQDTGHGIAAEDLPRIFEPFYTTKAAGQGTGLGLATVFGIVTQHGGWVEVDSSPGRGTIFQVMLPADEELAVRPDEAIGEQPMRGHETILLVEDDPAVRNLTRAVLESSGYRVLEAGNAADALSVWERHAGSVHLLLTDIVMPGGMSGRELAARLQADRPALRVIFTSGYSQEIAGRDLTLQERQNYIQKPCPPHRLLQTVRACLES